MKRLLLASDFHGRVPAFESFSLTLAHGPWDAGILAGDLMEEWLPGETDLPAALARHQSRLQTILDQARKPVYFVLGNHDVTPWPETSYLTDLHSRCVDLDGVRLVGYRWTRMDRYPHELEADLPALAPLVDHNTVLVTHSPPWGVLDALPESRFHFGLKGLLTLPQARWHVFGHVHECAGVQGRAVNVCFPALRKFFSLDLNNDLVEAVDPAIP